MQKGCQVVTEGHRCAIASKTREVQLWVQEPCERGPQAQAGPTLQCQRRGPVSHPDAGSTLIQGNSTFNVCADPAYRSKEMEAKLIAWGTEELRPPERKARLAAERKGKGQQPNRGCRARPGRTCLWLAERYRRRNRTYRRNDPRKRQDWNEEPRLQHATVGAAVSTKPISVVIRSANFRPRRLSRAIDGRNRSRLHCWKLQQAA